MNPLLSSSCLLIAKRHVSTSDKSLNTLNLQLGTKHQHVTVLTFQWLRIALLPTWHFHNAQHRHMSTWLARHNRHLDWHSSHVHSLLRRASDWASNQLPPQVRAVSASAAREPKGSHPHRNTTNGMEDTILSTRWLFGYLRNTPILWNTKFITMPTKAPPPLWSLFWARRIQSTPSHPVFSNHILMTFPSTPRTSKLLPSRFYHHTPSECNIQYK